MRPRTQRLTGTTGATPGARAIDARTRPEPSARGARNWRRGVIVASAAVLVSGMLFVLFRAPSWGRGEDRFLLSQVEVRGNTVLTEDEVVALSGVELGTSLLSIRIADVERSLSMSPRVQRAHASRVLPDRILVTLDERLPAALVAAGRNSYVEVADDGTALPAVERTPFVDLPLVTGAVGKVTPGAMVASDELKSVLKLLREACEVSPFLWTELSEVRIAPGSGLIIYTVADGAEVRVGSGALDSRGLSLLASVLLDLRAKGERAESIDLRFRDQVIVKERADVARGTRVRGGLS
jgi:cell division protein FtsQ